LIMMWTRLFTALFWCMRGELIHWLLSRSNHYLHPFSVICIMLHGWVYFPQSLDLLCWRNRDCLFSWDVMMVWADIFIPPQLLSDCTFEIGQNISTSPSFQLRTAERVSRKSNKPLLLQTALRSSCLLLILWIQTELSDCSSRQGL
jgi:hypothetical protein